MNDGPLHLHRSGLARTTMFVLVAALSTGACKSGSEKVASVSAAPVAPADRWAGREGVKDAIALLNAGDAIGARKRIIAVLTANPGDGIARKLIDQIDKDPKLLLGAQNFRYVVREGDSFSSLAQQFLGDPMMFYALARYNDFVIPVHPPIGRSILIPGKAKIAKKAAAKPQVGKKPAAMATNATPAPAAPKTVPAAVSDPPRASKLRGMALAAMNSGAIDRAVALLRQAHSADPANPVIKNDLSRAIRIQSSVRRK
jgi:hypothetical protein